MTATVKLNMIHNNDTEYRVNILYLLRLFTLLYAMIFFLNLAYFIFQKESEHGFLRFVWVMGYSRLRVTLNLCK